MGRTYDWNGKLDRVMSRPDLSDLEVAGEVRMLTRNQLDHEAVCTFARDRIMALSKEKLLLLEALEEAHDALRHNASERERNNAMAAIEAVLTELSN